MPTLPHPTPSPQATPVDCCPECVVNVEPPRSVTTTTDGIRATYLCADCGHAWTTSWKD